MEVGVKVVICDDEEIYRRILREKILQYALEWDCEAEITEYAEGSSLLKETDRQNRADVYFLDIETGAGPDDGIRTARELRRRGDEGLIVYVTGFIDYVQTGYEVRAFRYLLKSQIDSDLPRVLQDIRKELTGDSFFTFQKNRETMCVKLQDILYLESDRRLVRIRQEQGEEAFYGSLDDVEEQLSEKGFLRCHKSYLVHMDRVKNFSGDHIVMDDGSILPVSRSYGKEVKRELMLHFAG